MTSRTNRDARDDRATVYGGGVKSAFYNIGDRILGFAGIDTQAKKVANQHKNIGAGLNRARGNINQAQNELATTMNYNQLDALNRYTYNAFDDQWSKTNDDGTITTFDKGYGISDIMIADATVGSIGIDAQTYLEYSKQDAQLEKRIIENSKAQGKAETQQKKMEGSNGNK